MTGDEHQQGAHLVVHGLEKTFQSGGAALTVLSGLELEMNRGDQLAITGPSGSGKSTLLYIVGTLDEPTAGSVKVAGTDPFTRDESGLADFRSAEVGFIFQDHHLLPQCTVLENVMIPLIAAGGVDATGEERARSLLDRVGLSERSGHLPARISGGERQRVAVCRALINEPSLLLADEPTGNLDQKTAEGVGTLLLELSEERQAVLICVTHSSELASRFPRRCELTAGRLVDVGAAE
ncbi:MAG: ABC transporter ATP-binding protein [Planctomycetales bacterium]|nr:ABC transporter ATP-binding protein [Planctomycetales bacterium]